MTEAGCYAVVEVPSGKTTLFIERLPAEYAIWMGVIHPPATFLAKYGVDECLFVDELPAWLAAHPSVAAHASAAAAEGAAAEGAVGGALPAIHTLYGLNSDSGNSGPPLPNFAGFDKLASTYAVLRPIAVEVRVLKSAAEVAVLQKVNDVSSDAHLATMRHAKPGMVEYQLESLFKHHCYYNGGARNAAYVGICGCGPNAATLHYGHAGAPNDRLIDDGEMMLSDMGCEISCYCSDITCSYPIASNGKFTEDQRFIFETVALCQTKVMRAMAVGVEWASMHELTYRTICERLVEWGVLVGPVDAMMEANVGSFFMPHGLGHLIGCDTHDVGGYNLATSVRDKRRGFKSLRMQRPLIAGMVLTVEPGLYFIDVLLNELLSSPETKCFVVSWREGGLWLGRVLVLLKGVVHQQVFPWSFMLQKC